MSLAARKAKADDAVYLHSRLRPADKAEVKAASGMQPLQVLFEGLKLSTPCYTIYVEETGSICGMFGIIPVNPGVYGAIWMLGSEEIKTHAREFLRKCKPWMELLHKNFPALGNWVDERNTVHIRWLKWIGCSFVNKKNIGPENKPFLEFVHI